jgi:hypothetical protein
MLDVIPFYWIFEMLNRSKIQGVMKSSPASSFTTRAIVLFSLVMNWFLFGAWLYFVHTNKTKIDQNFEFIILSVTRSPKPSSAYKLFGTVQMLLFSVIFLSLSATACCQPTNEEKRAISDAQISHLSELTPFEPEEPCNNQGGICVEKQYCPPTRLADKPGKNLFYCPEQTRKGAVCCHGCEFLTRNWNQYDFYFLNRVHSL